MPDLPFHPDLDRLRSQGDDGDAVAREYGFASWEQLRTEVERRAILDGRDPARLRELITADPALATGELDHWCDHHGAAPLSYVAMMRYDTSRNLWGDVPEAAALARELLAAGAPVDGVPEEGGWETPLMTAASYGDAAVARVLIEAGAQLELRAAADSGGVPGGTALLHAAVFGMTDVVDVLVEAGAVVQDEVQAAAAGTLDRAPEDPTGRLLALSMAAHHQRLPVIELLVAAGTPVDGVDPIWGRQALWLAAQDGRPESVATLLRLGADPSLRDPEGRTALDLCRIGRRDVVDGTAHDQVEAILLGTTTA